MILRDLIAALGLDTVPLSPEVAGAVVRGVARDSRRVRAGDLFVAIPGLRVDGHDFAAAAVAAGAVAVVAGRPLPLPVPCLVAEDPVRALGQAAAALAGHPARDLTAVAVTGTNGKTTVTYLLAAILEEAGKAAGLIGTIAYRAGGKPRPSALTTPDAVALQGLFAEMRAAGQRHVVMEASSHALAQGRLWGCEVAVAGFTQLSQDHLDLHGTMEAYLSAKLRLFAQHLSPKGTAVVNIDGAASQEVMAAVGGRPDLRLLRCSCQSDAVEVSLHPWRADATGISGRLRTPQGSAEIFSPLLGTVNAENIVVAAGLAEALGLPLEAIASGLGAVGGVPGRLEQVRPAAPEGPTVVVDYAHTPDALARVLKVLRPLSAGRLIAIFGCGGDRDRGKRPLMGRAVAAHADLAVVTSDNPRSESPDAIVGDIIEGFEAAGWPELSSLPAGARGYLVEADRRRAIEQAIAAAGPEDTVLIAGKGHEAYQLIGDRRLPFDDRAVAEEVLLELGSPLARGTPVAVAGSSAEAPWEPQFVQRVRRIAWPPPICIDSRRLEAGQIFLAIKGARFDGHAYCAEAARKGAAALIVSEPPTGPLPRPLPLVEVPDTDRALAALARGWREEVAPQVVGITGSMGKTTTKEMTRRIADRLGPAHSNPGNFNNRIGLPLSILTMPRGTRVLVAELGMSGEGEITELAGILRPHIGVVTNVAPVHLEQLGSLEAIGRAKGELLRSLPFEGWAIYPAGELLLVPAAAHLEASRWLTFGEVEEARIRIVTCQSMGEQGYRALLEVDGVPLTLRLPLIGAHNVRNAAAAVGAGIALGVPAAEIGDALAAPLDLPHRMGLRDIGPFLVIDDCYNASPWAVCAALEALLELARNPNQVSRRPTIAVLGAMRELGAESAHHYQEVGGAAARLGLDLLVTVGQEAEAIGVAAIAEGLATSRVEAVATPEQAIARVADLAAGQEPPVWLLVKGSRSERLERIVDGLQQYYSKPNLS